MSRLVPGFVICMSVAAAAATGLTFATPDGWQSTPTSSSMRVAQFKLPRAAGDPEDGELVLYYFGGEGGSVEANMERWMGQMQQPDGRQASAVAKREARKVNGLAVTLLDVTGTYTAEMSPGAGEHHNSPLYRMRAGVVETPNGPYFIKLTGPQKTVTRWDQAFERFVGSLRFQP